MELICQLQNINLSFGQKILFSGASLVLNFGEKVGLLGPNGQGKSTLFRILTGEILPEASDPAFIFTKAKGREDKEKTFSIFHIPQELPFCQEGHASAPGKIPSIRNFVFYFYPELLAAHQAGDNAENAQEGHWEVFDSPVYQKVLNLYESYLKLFDVDDWDRPVSVLSGGEQRKLGLCLGLSSPANLILWDEPTNHLDMEAIELFEEELLSSSKALVLISHDRYLLNRVCHRILHLERGKLNSFEGNYFEYLNHLEENEKKRVSILEKLSNHMRREEAWMRQGIKARGTRSKKRVENYHDLSGAISHLKGLAKREMDLSLHDSGKKSKMLAELHGVHFSFPGKADILDNINLGMYKGEKIALLGKNGSGKSTLLKLIQGELLPSRGILKRNETLLIHLFDQKRMTLDPEKTPYQILGDGSDKIDLPSGEHRHVNAYLESFLFSRDDLHRPIKTFSGGEKNRLQLALFLKKEADLWIFDEPTNDLDLETMTLLEDKIKNFSGSVLVVSHDRAFLEQTTGKAWFLDEGRLKMFEGGLSQAYTYIQTLKLEKLAKEAKEMEEEKIRSSALTPELAPKAVKLGHKEKKRIEELPALIEKLEKTLETLDQNLNQFDYGEMSKKGAQGQAELRELQQKRDKTKEDLDGLYEEWLILEERR